MSRKDQAEATRKKIIEGVLRLSKRMPFEQIQIRDICTEAQVSVGNFYHHFTCKQDVVGGILFEYLKNASISREYLSVFPSKQRIVEILGKFVAHLENLGSEVVLETFAYNIANKTNFMLSTNLVLHQEILRTLQALKEEDRFTSNESVEEVCKEIIIVFRGFFYEWCLSGGGEHLREMIEKKMGRYLDLFVKEGDTPLSF